MATPLKLGHIKFSLSEMASIIGAGNHQNLLQANNELFSSMTVVPLTGIALNMLNLDFNISSWILYESSNYS